MSEKKCRIEGCNNKIYVKRDQLCNTHYLRQCRHGSTDRPRFRREILISQGKSYCPSCNEEKSLSEFTKDKSTAFGIAAYCRDCNKKKSNKRYTQYPEKHKNTTLRSSFGITLDEYNKLLVNQNNGCAICGRTETENGKMLSVDHDHRTKKIRGLLCKKCNSGLGLFGDNPHLIQIAFNYLQASLRKNESLS